MRVLFGLLAVALLPQMSDAQAKNAVEVFRKLSYEGGHSIAGAKRISYGALVLSDSGISYHRCPAFCDSTSKTIGYDSIPIFAARYSELKEVVASSSVRGPTVGSKAVLGILATDTREDLIAFVYETAVRAEAPILKTLPSQSLAVEAQIKFRARKAGHPIIPPL